MKGANRKGANMEAAQPGSAHGSASGANMKGASMEASLPGSAHGSASCPPASCPPASCPALKPRCLRLA